jgi:hypothetical protein
MELNTKYDRGHDNDYKCRFWIFFLSFPENAWLPHSFTLLMHQSFSTTIFNTIMTVMNLVPVYCYHLPQLSQSKCILHLHSSRCLGECGSAGPDGNEAMSL